MHSRQRGWMITSQTSQRRGLANSMAKYPVGGQYISFPSLISNFDAIYLNRPEALSAFEELFLYACPKFISANPPPYEDPNAISALLRPSSPTDSSQSVHDSTQRHLALFLSDVAAQLPVPTLRSFLKLYTSLDAKKLANFLDADEEEMVQEMMVMKQASKSLSRVPGTEFAGLLDGRVTTTSDLNFVIDEVSWPLSPKSYTTTQLL